VGRSGNDVMFVALLREGGFWGIGVLDYSTWSSNKLQSITYNRVIVCYMAKGLTVFGPRTYTLEA
jgi:hypothetical protein